MDRIEICFKQQINVWTNLLDCLQLNEELISRNDGTSKLTNGNMGPVHPFHSIKLLLVCCIKHVSVQLCVCGSNFWSRHIDYGPLFNLFVQTINNWSDEHETFPKISPEPILIFVLNCIIDWTREQCVCVCVLFGKKVHRAQSRYTSLELCVCDETLKHLANIFPLHYVLLKSHSFS